MKITFVSNYFNHHQRYLSDALAHKEDVDYSFVETKAMREERRQMGYGENYSPSYIVDQKDSLDLRMMKKLLSNSDVIINGSATEEIQVMCRNADALVFRYSERLFKNGCSPLKYIPRLIRLRYKNPSGSRKYLLCAGAYVADDYSKFGLYTKDRTYKWGYFPKTERYESDDILMNEKNNHELLWCGRCLDWKHPDDAIRVAKKLKATGYTITLNLIGCGNLEDTLYRMVESEGLSDCVHFLGSMSPDEVRIHMKRAGLFLFTSDKREGWGAVLNEAMNSGCAVVASHAIGSVPFLIKDEENGYIYESGNVNMLYEKVKYLLDHPEEQKRVGTAAYYTIINEWNAEVAAERFFNLATHILDGEISPDLYESGPCSKTQQLSDKWHGKSACHKNERSV